MQPQAEHSRWGYCLQVQLLSQAGAGQQAADDAVEVVGSTSLSWVSSSTASFPAPHQPPCPPPFDQPRPAVGKTQHTHACCTCCCRPA
jgi:hypothetical protein